MTYNPKYGSIRGWNKCCECGLFFSIQELSDGRVKSEWLHDIFFVDGYPPEETRYFYHVECRKHAYNMEM